ncbi:MAG: 3-dehydroquinate synthase [Anaerolineae bacterium]|nr:3-dehydroquinate synthase [Anaerolineae bacterium]
MALKELTVRGGTNPYPVFIGPGSLEHALPEFVAARGFSSVAVITNATLAPLYGEALADRLPNGFLIVVPDGEQYKTLDTVRAIYDQLLDAGADRSTLVIGLGGGVMGDMAGFAAASFMRGIAFVQAPTSLLAMVDASIGGKVGVDLPQGKNLVGAFKDPLAVFADTATLSTLPEIELRCGLAEVVKAGLIADPPLLDHLEQHGPDPIDTIIEQAVKVKIDVVGQDRLENGVRAHLNLGHTFGHAIEHVSGYAWKHGEGVAVGMVAAARLSERLNLCETGLADMVEQALIGVNLPVRYRGLDPVALWDAMRHDKKWRGGTVTFVLLERVGQPVIVRDMVPVLQEDVIDVLAGLREEA